MNPIKFLAFLFCSFLFFTSQALTAAEETKYVGTLSGVECTACKRTIARAISKLKGVKTIRIVKQSNTSHRLEVLTDGSRAITKNDATKALEKADHYKILSWRKS